MTPIEWEIVTRGLFEKYFNYPVNTPENARIIEWFIQRVVEGWKKDEKIS